MARMQLYQRDYTHPNDFRSVFWRVSLVGDDMTETTKDRNAVGPFFFFQAEDGIRDYKVTGVQTCALPISALRAVTLGAAEALGVADRLGSLEPGKIANVVAWAGEPLTKEAKVRMVFVDGDRKRVV